MKLLVFNPEHDFALAAGRKTFTPPKQIVEIRCRLALSMLPLASPGDFLLLPDDVSYKDIEQLNTYSQEIRPVKLSDLNSESICNKITEIVAWGWDFQIATLLRKTNIKKDLIPDDSKIEKICKLSHRSITIDFNRLLEVKYGIPSVIPIQFENVDECLEYAENQGDCFLKSPWSSSGRGILRYKFNSPEFIRQWVKGCIKRQGSVIAEPLSDKILDFATEWLIKDGKASFLGFSLFKTDSEGRFKSMVEISQEEIKKRITDHVPTFDSNLIKAQKSVLEELIAPEYEGPTGIDMMVTKDGTIVPCVEVNLRYTMGILSLSKKPMISIIGSGNVAHHLMKAFQKVADVNLVNPRTLEKMKINSDFFIICVKDSVIHEVANRMPRVEGIVMHTSGSVPIEELKGHRNYGVFYPLQTFSKDIELEYSDIPILTEANTTKTENKIREIAGLISRRVETVDSDKRKIIHLASVFTCNFYTHLAGISSNVLKEIGLDLSILSPLMKETLRKTEQLNPTEVQTGPAARGEVGIINEHLKMLEERRWVQEKEIYEVISKSIMEKRKKL